MWFVRLKWVVLWSMWMGRLVPQPTAPVRTRSGWLRGLVAPGGTHAAYTAVPYAEVEDRFRPAKPVSEWNGVYDAFDEDRRCTQRFGSGVIGTEDCLTLNVYTPLQESHNLPVMVFIHGGGFRDGSGSPLIYGPEYLVKQGVILVTFNYRVEILGFLCLGIKEAPGNVGLKDQVLAMRWIKQNIKSFGGDPDNITIFGESAGSASVMYHMMSPMSKGLFHKAIMESASALSPWTIQFEPLKTASLLAQQIGHNITVDPRVIANTFKNIDAKELMKVRVPRMKGDVILSQNVFVPCIEKILPDEEQFLLESPYDLITSGNFYKVPLIMGYNDAEGYMFVGKENDSLKYDFNVYDALPRDLAFPTDTEKKQTAEALEKYYMGGKDLVQLSRYEGDSGIIYPVVSTLELLMKTSDRPLYGYKFAYDGWLNMAKFGYGFTGYPGATHADELFYLFKVKVPLLNALLERDFVNYFTTLWTNFAKHGDPTPPDSSRVKWKPLNIEAPKLFVLNKTISEADLWENDVMLYWNSAYAKYRRKF